MTNNKPFIIVIAGFVLLMTSTTSAGFGGENLKISQFCDTSSPRQTLIYIDDKTLVKDQTQWAKDLIGKLSVNLMPSEPVTLIKLATETGESQQLWQACYPDYSPTQRSEIAKKQSGFASVFTGNPIDALPQQQAIFKSQLAGALEQLLKQSGRDLSAVQVNPTSPPNKQIMLALVNDAPRFDPAHGAIRVIIYSDMIEKSDLGSSLTSNPAEATAAATTRALNFKNAVFYNYGAGSTLSQPEASMEMKIKSYWEAFFTAADGHLAGFGSNLNVITNIPETLKTYDVAITITPDDIRVGKMQLFINNGGSIQDSFITVGNKHQSMLEEGSFKCQDANCSFSARIPTSVITTQGSAEFKLTGTLDSLKGTIQVPHSKDTKGKDIIFDMTAKLIK